MKKLNKAQEIVLLMLGAAKGKPMKKAHLVVCLMIFLRACPELPKHYPSVKKMQNQLHQMLISGELLKGEKI